MLSNILRFGKTYMRLPRRVMLASLPLSQFPPPTTTSHLASLRRPRLRIRRRWTSQQCCGRSSLPSWSKATKPGWSICSLTFGSTAARWRPLLLQDSTLFRNFPGEIINLPQRSFIESFKYLRQCKPGCFCLDLNAYKDFLAQCNSICFRTTFNPRFWVAEVPDKLCHSQLSINLR